MDNHNRAFRVKARPPAYLSLSDEQWEEKLQRSRELASPCVLCGRRCNVQRFISSEGKGTSVQGFGVGEQSTSDAEGNVKTDAQCTGTISNTMLMHKHGTSPGFRGSMYKTQALLKSTREFVKRWTGRGFRRRRISARTASLVTGVQGPSFCRLQLKCIFAELRHSQLFPGPGVTTGNWLK